MQGGSREFLFKPLIGRQRRRLRCGQRYLGEPCRDQVDDEIKPWGQGRPGGRIKCHTQFRERQIVLLSRPPAGRGCVGISGEQVACKGLLPIRMSPRAKNHGSENKARDNGRCHKWVCSDHLRFVRLFYAALAADAVDQGVAGSVGRVGVHEGAEVLGGVLVIAKRVVGCGGVINLAQEISVVE